MNPSSPVGPARPEIADAPSTRVPGNPETKRPNSEGSLQADRKVGLREAPMGFLSGCRSRTPSRAAGPKCIDVRALGRFKVRPSGDHVRGSRIDPWNLEILCHKGKIYPHGGTRLQAYTDRRMARVALKALDCVQVHQDGDRETTVIFEVGAFERVAAVLRPRKRRPAPLWLRNTRQRVATP